MIVFIMLLLYPGLRGSFDVNLFDLHSKRNSSDLNFLNISAKAFKLVADLRNAYIFL